MTFYLKEFIVLDNWLALNKTNLEGFKHKTLHNSKIFNIGIFATFNDGVDELWEYRSRFLILLVAFGAKSKYCIPRIVGEFDKTNMKQYEFFMIPEGNRKYSGVITDGQGNDVAYV